MIENKIYNCGQFTETSSNIDVVNPYNQEQKKCGQASKEQLEQCISETHSQKEVVKRLSSRQRKEILYAISEGIQREKEAFIDTIIFESGKPYIYAKGEVERAIQTFHVAAEEVGRNEGEYIALDWTTPGEGKSGLTQRFPIGVVGGIAPFNFPLNLVAHKVAPAIASGCPIILKPASKTPFTALKLAEVVHQTNLPDIGFSVMPCDRETGNLLVTSEKIALLSFTGSPAVGWKMKAHAGKKKVVLELGGNAAAIIHQDADLDHAVERMFIGGFAYSGQVCIHTQRMLVHEAIYDQFKNQLKAKVEDITIGPPSDHNTQFSCMISQHHADRVETWTREALKNGSTPLLPQKKEGTLLHPIILENVKRNEKVYAEEVFGPVVILEKYSTIEAAIQKVNDSKFGLQASIFTNQHDIIQKCFTQIDVGGLIVNDSTTFRVDHMPYGGIKDSGLGREGLRYAIEDMSEIKLLVQ